MPGAIGVLLYADPAKKRGGSLSVWASEDDLRRFVALPRHVAIMRRYRERVSVRSAMWQTTNFRTKDAWAERHERLAASARADSAPAPQAGSRIEKPAKRTSRTS